MTSHRSRAFILTEFLIATFIAIVMITITVEGFVFLNKDYKVLVSYLSSYLKGREAIDLISKDCRIAIRVLDSYSGFTTTNSCLVLKVPSIDAAGDIIDVDNEFDYIIYSIVAGNLRKVVMPGANSARPAYNGIFKEDVESLYMEHNGTPLSGIVHKSVITYVTSWVSIVETILGKDYRVTPGTTVKLMNYEWEHVR